MIVHDTDLIGIPNDSVGYRAVEMEFHNSRGKLLGEADILFGIKDTGVMYVVEYKCNDSEIVRTKAREQITKAKKGLKDQYGFRIEHGLYVYGPKFTVEELLDEFVLIPDNQEYVKRVMSRLD